MQRKQNLLFFYKTIFYSVSFAPRLICFFFKTNPVKIKQYFIDLYNLSGSSGWSLFIRVQDETLDSFYYICMFWRMDLLFFTLSDGGSVCQNKTSRRRRGKRNVELKTFIYLFLLFQFILPNVSLKTVKKYKSFYFETKFVQEMLITGFRG